MSAANTARVLNNQGWIIERDTQMGETWCREMGDDDSPLRRAGYKGGKVECHGNFYPGHANVHILIDPDRIEYEDAVKIRNHWAATTPP